MLTGIILGLIIGTGMVAIIGLIDVFIQLKNIDNEN